MSEVGRVTVDGLTVGRILVGYDALHDSGATTGLSTANLEDSLGGGPGYSGPGGPKSGAPIHGSSGLNKTEGPTFRPGLHPRGKLPPAKPPHFTTEDIKGAIEGKTAGGIDRSQFRAEASEKGEELVRRAAAMVAGEIGDQNNLKAQRVQLETAFNRAQIDRTSLEQALHIYGREPRGYYPQSTYNHGYQYIKNHPEWYANFKENVWKSVMAGSNVSDVGFGPMTGNASAGVAARQIAKGTPYYHLPGGDTYFQERHGKEKLLPRISGVPQGVTRLGAGEAPAVTDNSGNVISGHTPSPITGTIHQGPGAARKGHIHQGVDIFAPVGTPVRATGSGTLMSGHYSPGITGGIVKVRYDDGTIGSYMHLSNWSTMREGSRVRPGDVIGLSGNPPGTTHMPHLHYEVHRDGRRLDPAVYHGWGQFGPRGEGLFGKRVSSEASVQTPHYTVYSMNDIRKAVPDEIRRDAPSSSNAPLTRPLSPQPKPTPTSGTILFLHGMESRYGKTSPADVEASIREYAAKVHKSVEFLDVSGDFRRKQLQAAQARINRGGITDVIGFSAGGYASQHLKGVTNRLAIGAPGVPYNRQFPGRHMEQAAGLARSVDTSIKGGSAGSSDTIMVPP